MSVKIEQPRVYGADAVSAKEIVSYLYKMAGSVNVGFSEIEREILAYREQATAIEKEVHDLSLRIESLRNWSKAFSDEVKQEFEDIRNELSVIKGKLSSL